MTRKELIALARRTYHILEGTCRYCPQNFRDDDGTNHPPLICLLTNNEVDPDGTCDVQGTERE